MSEAPAPPDEPGDERAPDGASHPDTVCPVCGGLLVSEKCKVVCRSERCLYRIVFNCAEF